MLYTLVFILLIFWLLGLTGRVSVPYGPPEIIHVVLVIIVVLLLLEFLGGGGAFYYPLHR